MESLWEVSEQNNSCTWGKSRNPGSNFCIAEGQSGFYQSGVGPGLFLPTGSKSESWFNFSQ